MNMNSNDNNNSPNLLYDDADDIANILEKIFLNQNSVMVEQDGAYGQKVSIKALIINVNLNTKEFSLRPTSFNDVFSLDTRLPLAIITNHKNIFFQSKISFLNTKKLINVKFPKDISIINTRRNERINFEDFLIPVKLRKLGNDEILVGELIDISETGIALRYPSILVNNFVIGEKIQIISLNDIDLANKTFGKIVYTKLLLNFINDNRLKIAIEYDFQINIFSLLDLIKGKDE